MTSALSRVAAARNAREGSESAFVEAIVSAHAAGESYRRIAEHAGLSHQRIAQLVTSARTNETETA